MAYGYEINELAKEESWRMFRIIGELVEGFDSLAGIEPAVTMYGSSRLRVDDKLYAETEEIAYRLGQVGFSIVIWWWAGRNGGCQQRCTEGRRYIGGAEYLASRGAGLQCLRHKVNNVPSFLHPQGHAG